jgi:hypothetical protein
MSEDLEDLVRKSIMFAIIICSLLIFHVALSHEVTAAEGVKTGALSMKRQHEAMETLDRQWTKVKDAVKKGDFAAASRGITFMERRLAPDIEKFQLHRHAEKRDQYLRCYEDFVQSLRGLRNAVATKDAPRSAPGPVKGVEDSCKQCHDLFAGGHH